MQASAERERERERGGCPDAPQAAEEQRFGLA